MQFEDAVQELVRDHGERNPGGWGGFWMRLPG